MPRPSHARLQEMVAIHALHALDPAESAQVEDHLRSCPRCRAEFDAHLETAAMLGGGGADAPPAVWARIASELDAPTPPLQISFERRQKALIRRSFSVAAVAAAVAIALLSWQSVRLDDRTDELRQSIARSEGAQAALAAFTDPGAHRIQLTSPDGSLMLAAAVLPDGQGWLLADSLPSLSANQTYQLWWVGEGKKVSLGVLGHNPAAFSFRVAPGAEMLVVTAEPAPGVTTTDNSPVVAGRFIV